MKARTVLFFFILLLCPLLWSSPHSQNSPFDIRTVIVDSAGTTCTEASPPPPPSPDAEISPLAARETAFYGVADDPSVRNITGHADYIVCSHALYNGGASIRDNVRYLSDHGVKVILDTAWWGLWPFPDGGVNGWEDLYKQNVVYGMNATEAVKYRIRGMMNEIGPEYVWGVTIDEEVGTTTGFPWTFIAWYLNLFYDWIHEEFPGVRVLQWPAYYTSFTNPSYHVKADGIVYDNYDQTLTMISDQAAALAAAYPDVPLLFYISAAEHIGTLHTGWSTCHTSTYTKNAVRAIAPYAEIIGFWTTFTETGEVQEGWEFEHDGYKLALKLCNEIHLMDTTTIWGSTEWFYCDFGNDTMTDSLSHWNASYFYTVPADPALNISSAADWRVGDAAVNLTCTESGQHSFWWQPLSHDYGFADYPEAGPYGAYNMSAASRLTYWVRGIGWDNHPSGRAYISIEKYNSGRGYLGNMTLPDITSLLTDGQWHRIDLTLPLDPSMYYQWNGYGGQVRVVVDYSGSSVSNTTSILLDGWEVQSFDTGKACNLATSSDYVNVTNGVLHVVGNAYFEIQFPQTDAWYWEWSGTGTIQMLLNGSWTTPPDEGVPCRWNVSAIRLYSGVYDWVKVNAIPPLVEIVSPLEGALLSGATLVEVNAMDESGIQRVEFAVDGSLQFTDYAAPFTWTWSTAGFADGVHDLNATAYATSGAVNFHDIEVVLDNTEPSVSITAPSNNTLVQGSVPVTVTATDASGIAQVAFYADGTLLAIDASPPYSCSWNTVSGSDGARNLTSVARDNAGNTKAAFHRIVVDNTNPSVAVHSLVIGDGQVLVAANATDASGIQRVEFYLNGELNFTDSLYPYQWTWLTTGYLDGSYTVRVVAYDVLGHSGYVDAGVVLDRTLPTLSVTRSPLGSPVRGSVAVTAVASDANGIAYVEFFVDAHLEFTDWGAPYTWTWNTRLFGDGAHTLLVVAVDNYGNAKAAQSEVVVDNSAPTIAINTPSNGSLLEGPVAVVVVATVADPAGVHVVLLSYSTGGAWTNVSMGLSGGYYQGVTGSVGPGVTLYVRVYANDTLGNGAASLRCIYSVDDSTPPSLFVGYSPLPGIVRGLVHVTVTPTDVSPIAMVVFSVDGVPVAWLVSAPYQYDWNTRLWPDGSHAFRVRANDTWGNANFEDASFDTDNTGPGIIVDYPLNQTSLAGPVSFRVEAIVTDTGGVASVILSFTTGGAWTNQTMVLTGSRYVWTSLLLNPGTTLAYRVFAIDGLGNQVGSQGYLGYVTDETPPTVQATFAPSPGRVGGTVHIVVSALDLSGISMVILIVDGFPVAWLSSAPYEFDWNTRGETDGSHAVGVWANDTWDNSDYTEEAFVVDNSGPSIVVDFPANETALAGPIRFQVEALVDDGAGLLSIILSYSIGGGWTNETMVLQGSRYIWTSALYDPGVILHYRVFAIDGLGNQAGSAVFVGRITDATPPSVSLLSSPLPGFVSGLVYLTVSPTDLSGVATVLIYVDGVRVASFATPPYEFIWSTHMWPDGQHTVRAWANDTWGNSNYVEASYVIDNTGPTILVDYPGNQTSIGGPIAFRVEAVVDDNVSVTNVILSFSLGGPWTNQSMALEGSRYVWTSALLGPGTTLMYRVFATDALGNQAGSPQYVGFITDETSPIVTFSSSPVAGLVAGTVHILVSPSDLSGISFVLVYVDGVEIQTFAAPPYECDWDTRLWPDGAHTVRVWANDTWSNSNYSEAVFTVDNTSPVIEVRMPANETILDAPSRIDVEATGTDLHGPLTVILSFSTGGTWTNESMVAQGSTYIWNSSLYVAGTVLEFCIYATDAVGNTAYTDVYHCHVDDLSGPVIGILSLSPKVPTPLDNVTVFVTVTDYSGVSRVLLAYRVDGGAWINLTMTAASAYWVTLPRLAQDSVVDYRVYANDTVHHWSLSPIYQYTVVPFDVLPPTVHTWYWSPLAPNETNVVTVFANVTDSSTVVTVLLSYHDGALWHNVSMTLQSGHYVGVVPPLPYHTTVTLKLYASDGQDNWGVTPLGQYTVLSSDRVGPTCTSLAWSPVQPTEGDDVVVFAVLTDTNGIRTVILSYRGGLTWLNTTMSFNGTGYVTVIPAFPPGTHIGLKVYACDGRDNWAVTTEAGYDVILSDSNPPVIAGVGWTPQSPFANESILVTATITDVNPIALALLSYFDGTQWRNLTLTANGVQYSTVIPAVGVQTTIRCRVLALDAKGNWAISSLYDIDVRATPTEPPVDVGPAVAGGIMIGASVVGIPLVIGVAGYVARRRYKKPKKR